MEPILCNPFPIKKTTYIMHYILIFFLLLLNNKHSLKRYFNNYHPFSGLPWQKTNASLLFLGDDPILELNRKLAHETLALGLLQKCAICLRSAYRKTLKSLFKSFYDCNLQVCLLFQRLKTIATVVNCTCFIQLTPALSRIKTSQHHKE